MKGRYTMFMPRQNNPKQVYRPAVRDDKPLIRH